MSTEQEIEIQGYHNELVRGVSILVEKYRRIMVWGIPENDERMQTGLSFRRFRMH